MTQNTEKLRVASPRGRNSATNEVLAQHPPQQQTQHKGLKALAEQALVRNTERNRPQQVSATSATNSPPKNTHLLRSVVMVPDGHSDPIRWPRFVALCEAKGVGVDDVKTLFSDTDIDDLCEHTDDQLPAFAISIVQAIRRTSTRTPPAVDVAVVEAKTYTELHRCGRCAHYRFNPTTGSTGLGTCSARTDVSMAVPSRLIECDHYIQRIPT